jgi:hypothetical protein
VLTLERSSQVSLQEAPFRHASSHGGLTQRKLQVLPESHTLATVSAISAWHNEPVLQLARQLLSGLQTNSQVEALQEHSPPEQSAWQVLWPEQVTLQPPPGQVMSQAQFGLLQPQKPSHSVWQQPPAHALQSSEQPPPTPTMLPPLPSVPPVPPVPPALTDVTAGLPPLPPLSPPVPDGATDEVPVSSIPQLATTPVATATEHANSIEVHGVRYIGRNA